MIKVDIIGAGIGGLTTALALQQQGFTVHVFESAPEIKPVGAGILMANNAMQIFNRLGIREKIEQAGMRIASMSMTDPDMKPILHTDFTPFEKKYGVHSVAIYRADLQKILADAVGYGNISLSKKLVHIRADQETRLTFEDGSQVSSALVIAADGINSIVRKQLFPATVVRDNKQTCWRGVCDFQLPESTANQGFEAWGPGIRFGFTAISKTSVYWYAVSNAGLHNESAADVARNFHALCRTLVDQTDPATIYKSDTKDLKPISGWWHKNVCLLGDAAHATTPNMGQGGCQAVEDAWVMSQLLHRNSDHAIAFRKYEAIRRKKAHQIVNRSRLMGRVAQIESHSGIAFRNFIMRSTPAFASHQQLDGLFNLSYIDKAIS